MTEEVCVPAPDPPCFVCARFDCAGEGEHKVDEKTMEFIRKAREKHGYTYGYEKVVYVRSTDKVVIVCGKHGEFEQGASKHYWRGDGCMKCSGHCREHAQENFRKRIKELGGKVVGEYKGIHVGVECKCLKKHKCKPVPSYIRDGGGMCKICANLDTKTAGKNFNDAIEKLGGCVIGEYKNAKVGVDCICPEKHRCKPIPSSIQQGNGMCKICSKTDLETSKKKFVETIELLGGCVIGEYIGTDVRVDCICPEKHKCKPIPSRVRQGGGMCRICAKRDPETTKKNFFEIIEKLGGCVIGEYKGVHIGVECLCPEEHSCRPSPSHIQQGGGMCRICSGKDFETSKKNFFENIEKLGGQVIGEYKGAHIRVNCLCPEKHRINPTPANIRKGLGIMCNRCSQTKKYSKGQIEWLESVSRCRNISIQHAENEGEYKIKIGNRFVPMDGYCEETKTVYEYHGDFWHGNPKFYDPKGIHPISKKTFGRLFKNTLHKEMKIRNAGYNYVCIWEHEWNLMNVLKEEE
jgi:hypothetical protein